MKKFLALILAALCLLSLCAAAAADTYATVTGATSLNVRSGPSSSYAWLGSVGKGGWVRVTGESGNWYSVVTVEENITGYMSKNYLTTASATGGNTAVVNNPKATQFLNLRATPSYDANVLGIFYNGAVCTILGEYDGWYYVQITTTGGVTLQGYFRGEYLSLSGGASSATVSTANGGKLNLRTAPTYTGSNVTMQIPNGSRVSVLLKGKPFWQVSYNGVSGFADSSFLKEGAGGSSGAGGANGAAVVRTGNAGKLNLREQAYGTAKILSQYANGVAVTLLQQGAEWCYVRVNSDGQTGYMMTKYLHITAPASAAKTVINPNGGNYVNLRSAPAKSGDNVTIRVPVGARVSVLSWGDVWSQVVYNGTAGYMMSWFLT